MKTKRYFTFTLMLTVMSFGIPAIAELTFYTDRSDWETAVGGGFISEDFDSVTPDFLTEGANSAGLIDIELLNISPTNEYNYIDDGLLWSGWTPFFHGNLYFTDPDAMINLIFRSPVSAFGGDFESTNDSDGLWLEVNGEQYAFVGDDRLPFSGDGSGFLGFVSTNAFTAVTLFDPVKKDSENGVYRFGESFNLDNVRFVTVPEPVSFSFLVFGALCLRKRRKV